MAKKNGIQVIIFNAPLMDVIYEKRQRNGVNKKYEEIVKGWQKKFKNISIMQPLFISYERQYFKDAQHLNGRGFEIFSRQLVDQLFTMGLF